jgi:hypothetical protein
MDFLMVLFKVFLPFVTETLVVDLLTFLGGSVLPLGVKASTKATGGKKITKQKVSVAKSSTPKGKTEPTKKVKRSTTNQNYH